MEQAFLVAACALLIAAAVWDARVYRIPNRLCLALAALFLIRVAATGPASLLLNVLPAALVVLGATLLFSRGLMGGGDVKLLGAAALWVPPDRVLDQVASIAVIGAVLAILLHTVRRRVAHRNASALPRVLHAGAPVPYGIAITLGTLTSMLVK